MPFHQSGAGCFYFENRNGPARDPPTEGESILFFSEFFLTLGLQMVDIYSILKE